MKVYYRKWENYTYYCKLIVVILVWIIWKRWNQASTLNIDLMDVIIISLLFMAWFTIVWFQNWCSRVGRWHLRIPLFDQHFIIIFTSSEVKEARKVETEKEEINHEESFAVWYESTHCVCLMQWLSHRSCEHRWMPSFMWVIKRIVHLNTFILTSLL